MAFAIQASHVYADSIDLSPQNYKVTVTVTDVDGNTLNGTEYVSVTRPQVSLYTDALATPANSLSLTNVQVAAFSMADPGDGTGEFSATINWGDNSSSSGTIEELGPGLFGVLGSHTYGNVGVYKASVDVSQEWQVQKPVAEKNFWVDAGTEPILGPNTVPGNSIYTYYVPMLGPLVNPNNAWTITTNPAVGGGAVPKVLITGKTMVPFLSTPRNAYFADIQFSNTNAVVATITVKELLFKAIQVTFVKKVNVVKVVADANQATSKTTLAPRANFVNSGYYPERVAPLANKPLKYVLDNYYGNDAEAFKFTGRTLATEAVAKWKSGNPTFEVNEMEVTLTPPADGPASAIEAIEVGFIQTVRVSGGALYGGGFARTGARWLNIAGKSPLRTTMLDWVADAKEIREKTEYVDFAPADPIADNVWPWYLSAFWKPKNAADRSHPLSMNDSPYFVLPLYYSPTEAFLLSSGEENYYFVLNLAAHIIENYPQFLPMSMGGASPQGRSDYLYYSEAYINWNIFINASATPKITTGKVTSSRLKPAWILTQAPLRPKVNVVPAVVGNNMPYATWDPRS